KLEVKSNEKRMTKIETKQEANKTQNEQIAKDLNYLRDKHNSRLDVLDKKIDTEIDKIEAQAQNAENKTDKDRKFLVTTIVSVAVLAVSLISTIITMM